MVIGTLMENKKGLHLKNYWKEEANMEEKGKTAKLAAVKTETKGTKEKLSYEELEKFAYQLAEQAKSLRAAIDERDKALEEMNGKLYDAAGVIKRIEFLIEIVKNSNVKFSETFATVCAEEVERLMTIPKEEKSDDGTKKDGVQTD